MMRRKISIMALILACAAALWFLMPSHKDPVIIGQSKQDIAQSQTTIEGFLPGVAARYKVFADTDLVYEGQAQSQNGVMKFVHPDIQKQDVKTITYDLQLGKGDDILNILMRLDPQTVQMTASGNGLDQFSDIAVQNDPPSKADWAGLFYETAHLEKTDSESGVFQIALSGASGLIAPDNRQSPALIKVASSYPLSTSNTGAMNAQKDLIEQNYIKALMLMTEQLSAVVMQHTMLIGQLFDAKQQLETQRLQQTLTAQAHKDYHPSTEMCRIGSYIRSVSTSEEKAAADHSAMNEYLMTRYMNEVNAASAEGKQIEFAARFKQFRETYCDPKDHNNGLSYLCEHDYPDGDPTNGPVGATDKMRMNKDIDFARTIDNPMTLNIDFQNNALTGDEEDALALANNLYWLEVYGFGGPKDLPDKYPEFMNARQIVALTSVAHNSYTNLTAMKSRAADVTVSDIKPGWMFMKTLLKDEFGIPPDQVNDLVGTQPSYWAQMDILTKKIYQSPHFYTNLYTKPTNIDRMSVALDAIKLMQMRDHFDSSLRREMLISGLIERELMDEYEKIETRLITSNQ
ncbi:MAG: hypothetical protein ACPGRX_01005 [Bdellovibrionales bacterium]